MDRFAIVVGDITESDAEAIVNAANESLLGGSGVDGAIHRAAGPELLSECRTFHGCPTGEARLTKGYRLKASYVLHTPGPIWRGGQSDEAEKLASCYRSCLQLAAENGIVSVDFPCISTGVFGYPAVQAATVSLRAIMSTTSLATAAAITICSVWAGFCCAMRMARSSPFASAATNFAPLYRRRA